MSSKQTLHCSSQNCSSLKINVVNSGKLEQIHNLLLLLRMQTTRVRFEFLKLLIFQRFSGENVAYQVPMSLTKYISKDNNTKVPSLVKMPCQSHMFFTL